MGEFRYLEIGIFISNSLNFDFTDESYNELFLLVIGMLNEMMNSNLHNNEIIIRNHNYENVIKILSKIILIQEGKMHYVRDNAERVGSRLFGRFGFFVRAF